MRTWSTLIFVLSVVQAADYSEYSDVLARKMLVLAASAYSPTPEQCLQNRFQDGVLEQRFERICDLTDNNTCAGYIATLHADKVVAVVFRGTTSKTQLHFEGFSGFWERHFFHEMGRVNRYFHKGFEKLWKNGMGDVFEQVTKRHPDYSVWVTGHSLGGALASLASAHIVKTGNYNSANSAHYSFGQPRVGDDEWAEKHSELIPHYYRVAHARDIVVDLFPLSLGYRHHINEVWYDNSMLPGASFKVCRKNFDWKCIKLPIPLPNMLDHRYYFNTKVTTYGKTGCQKEIPV